MKSVDPRPASEDEVAVLIAALDRAAASDQTASSGREIKDLKVVGRCECGCDSVFFEGIQEGPLQDRLADGLGYAADGEEIGIIVWALNGRIVHLELYNYTEKPARLPCAETVCAFENARRPRE